MNIQTKFQSGDTIYYFNSAGQLQHNSIIAIHICIDGCNAPVVTYVTETDDYIVEGGAFAKPEDISEILDRLK